MIARGGRLVDSGLSVGEQTREQQAGLDLRAGHRHSIGNALQPGSGNVQGRAIAIGNDLCAHLAQRLHHAPHRTPRERLIADQLAGEGLRRHDARQHSHGRA